MTNLTKYEVLDVTSWNGDTSRILKNHIYDTTTDISICGRVNLAQWHLTCDGPAFTSVECKSCAKAYDKLKETVETETVEKTEQAEHIISELSQAAMNLRYVQATCDNDDEYADVLTAEQCNELDNMFERLQDILKSLGK
jgi:hypothetical protein